MIRIIGSGNVYDKPIQGLSVLDKGENNSIWLGEELLSNNQLRINIVFKGNNATFTLQNSKYPITMWLSLTSGNKVDIGANFLCWGLAINNWGGKNVKIGNDNLFSDGLTFMPADAHQIIRLGDNRILNPGGSIEIGNHNWIGKNAVFLKNSGLGNDCVVGFNSVVTKNFPVSNCVLAGSPAKIIKSNIYWKL